MKNKGSILILALWSVSLLSAFAVILGYEVRQKVGAAYRLNERDELSMLADAGIQKAAAFMRGQPEKLYYALSDKWSNDSTTFKDIQLGGGRFSLIASEESAVDDPSLPQTHYGMVDEDRKININTADIKTIAALCGIVLGIDDTDAQDLAASIIDWRTPGNGSVLPGGGAKDGYYHSLDQPYDAKSAPYEVIDELLLVKGMTPDAFSKMKNYVTIYGSGKVNINTASEAVLLALGIPKIMAERIILLRNGSDGISGTADDAVFDSNASIIPRLTQHYSLSPSEISALSDVADRALTSVSSYFTVRSRGSLLNKKNTMESIAVIDLTGKICYWREP